MLTNPCEDFLIFLATEKSPPSTSPNVTFTYASFLLLYVDIKWKSFSARKVLLVESPRAKSILSIILLFPEPFGPEIVVNPFNRGISVLLANDLKLSISSCFMYIKSLPQFNYH